MFMKVILDGHTINQKYLTHTFTVAIHILEAHMDIRVTVFSCTRHTVTGKIIAAIIKELMFVKVIFVSNVIVIFFMKMKKVQNFERQKRTQIFNELN